MAHKRATRPGSDWPVLVGTICATVGAASGCAAPDAAPTRPTRTVVGDATFVDNVIDSSNPVPVWRLEEDLRLGARHAGADDAQRMESDGNAAFGLINAVAVDGAGRMFVLDAMADEVRLFDRNGSLVRTIGRAGQGPGEFASPIDATLDEDGRLWVRDSRRGLAVFDTSGAHLVDLREPRVSWLGVFGPDGTRYEPGLISRDRRGLRNFVIRIPAVAFPAPGDGPLDAAADPAPLREFLDATRDTMWLPWFERAFILEDERPGLRIADPAGFIPHSRKVVYAVDARGFVWSAWNDVYQIGRSPFNDPATLVVRLDRGRIRVDDAERDSVFERLRTVGAEDADIVPRFKPAMLRLYVDTEARLWVLRYGAGPNGREGPARFDVFDRAGAFIAEAEAPTIPYSLEAITNEAVYTVDRDELDVPFIVRLRIVRD